MAVLSSRAHERPSREKNKNVAPAPISSRFLCPRPPLLLSAPNQNRHATQATMLLACFLLPPAHSIKKNFNHKKLIGDYTAGLLVPFHIMVCYEEVCVAADLPSLTLSRESHDFTTFLTSWPLISHAFSKVKLRKNFGVVRFVSKKDIASSIHCRKRLAVVFDYILFAYRDLPLPPNEQTYCFAFKLTANKTGKLLFNKS